jgi:mono/diheme cytochrome c family protein
LGLGFVLASGLASGLGGCGRDPSGGSGPKDGPAVFGTLCATCHGPDGRPPASMVARLAVRDLTAPDFRARVTPGLVEQQVRTGSKNKLMPSFEGLIDDAQIKAVAAYVASPQFVARSTAPSGAPSGAPSTAPSGAPSTAPSGAPAPR